MPNSIKFTIETLAYIGSHQKAAILGMEESILCRGKCKITRVASGDRRSRADAHTLATVNHTPQLRGSKLGGAERSDLKINTTTGTVTSIANKVHFVLCGGNQIEPGRCNNVVAWARLE
jgi:hypothetical protein